MSRSKHPDPTRRGHEALHELTGRIGAVCKARGWSQTWSARGAYLHLEASELIEAVRGKRGDPTAEAADVLIVLLSIIGANGMHADQVVRTASERVDRLETIPTYPGEAIGE